MEKETRSGMYDEMPVIKIGKYTIAEMSDAPDCDTVWIKDTENDDAAEFKKAVLLPALDEFFNNHF